MLTFVQKNAVFSLCTSLATQR